MRKTTLSFLIKKNQILLAMKKRGFGSGRWNGVGGKVKRGEKIEDAAIRETMEEIGVTPRGLKQVAVLDFYYADKFEGKTFDQQVHVFLIGEWSGEPVETKEMLPRWFKKDQLPFREMWDDDSRWLPNILSGKLLKGEFIFDRKEKVVDYHVELGPLTDMKPITLRDKIYGTYRITSPLILRLLQSSPVQRLKKIAQFGVPNEFYHLKGYSRYDHSVGVFLLLRKLGASELEQIAGLLHDVSHTAFSHVVDYVYDMSELEEYQDTQHESFILNSEIKTILMKYGINPNLITNYHLFRLLEQRIPYLCADRVDYALREFPLKIARLCLGGIMVAKNRIVFNDRELALLFAKNFLDRQKKHWGGSEAVVRYRIFAKALKEALDKNIIRNEDLWRYDDFIVKKLKKSTNKKIQSILILLKNKSLDHLPKGEKILHKKFRYVDPQVITPSGLKPLSAIDHSFRTILQKERKRNKRGVKERLITI